MSIIITTSHKPSPRLRSFVKDLVSVIPGSIKLNRGKKTLEDLLYDAIDYGADRLVIVGERKGNPGSIRVYIVDADEEKLKELAYYNIRGVKLSRENPYATRIYNPSILMVDSSSIKSEVEEKFVDIFSRSFKAKIHIGSLEEIAGKVDVLAVPRWDGKVIKLFFINPSTKKLGGPVIKFNKVIDYEGNKSIP